MCNGRDLICTQPDKCGGQCWLYGTHSPNASCKADKLTSKFEKLRDRCITKFQPRIPDGYNLEIYCDKKWSNGRPEYNFQLYPKDGVSYFASFTLREMEHCCAFLLSTGMFVIEKLRKQGIGSLLQEIKIWWAIENQYGGLIATVATTNNEEAGLLKKFGWKASETTVLNPKTGNIIETWIKDLN